MTVAAAAAAFLLWNWQPAKVFLGDAGAVPLGFLLGWVLLVLAAAGQWAPAVILPLVFVADASLTLLRRLINREPVWQAHRGHFYQRAAVGMGSHGRVVAAVSLVNLALVLVAALAAVRPATAVGGVVTAAVLVAALLWYLHRAARPPHSPA
jgi:UDP-N-acetylmuramyl pentapeptide phosphotransferase/UDP-N-acetylglucosamine-1-phosphate transferase